METNFQLPSSPFFHRGYIAKHMCFSYVLQHISKKLIIACRYVAVVGPFVVHHFMLLLFFLLKIISLERNRTRICHFINKYFVSLSPLLCYFLSVFWLPFLFFFSLERNRCSALFSLCFFGWLWGQVFFWVKILLATPICPSVKERIW